MDKFILTRKQIGEIIFPNTSRPYQHIGFYHSNYPEMFVKGVDYIKVGKSYKYSEDCVELFKMVVADNIKRPLKAVI